MVFWLGVFWMWLSFGVEDGVFLFFFLSFRGFFFGGE